MNIEKQFRAMRRVAFGPAGGSAMFARCPAPPELGQPFVDGIVLARVADGTLANLQLGEEPVAVVPGVFELGDVLVCVVLAIVGEQYFPMYVNLRNEREVAPLRAMARQGFAVLAVCDGTHGMLMAEHRPPANIFAQTLELLQEVKPWSEAQYRDARKAFELSFEDDIEGLAAAVASDANVVLAKSLLRLPAGTTVH